MKTKKMNWFTFALAPLMTFATIGCDVDVEESGTLPSVNVTEGEMPKIDMESPEVTMEKEMVEVPSVDVDYPEDGE